MGFWLLVPGVGMGGGAATSNVSGAACWSAGEVYLPGFQAGETRTFGFVAGDVMLPGFAEAEREC